MRHARSIYPVRVKKPVAEGGGEELRVFKRGDSKIYRVHELDVVDRALVENSVDYSYIFGLKDASELPSEEAINALGCRNEGQAISLGRQRYSGRIHISWPVHLPRYHLAGGGLKNNGRTPALDLDSVSARV